MKPLAVAGAVAWPSIRAARGEYEREIDAVVHGAPVTDETLATVARAGLALDEFIVSVEAKSHAHQLAMRIREIERALEARLRPMPGEAVWQELGCGTGEWRACGEHGYTDSESQARFDDFMRRRQDHETCKVDV